jgi:hypothetical protein
VRALNDRGVTDIIAVDNLKRADKVPNLVDLEIADYYDKQDFIGRIRHALLRDAHRRRAPPGRLLRHDGAGRHAT